MIETSRLLLREMVEDDLDDLAAVLGDDLAMRFYPHPFSRDDCRQWISRWRESYEVNGYGLWAMVLKDEDQVIGDCGLALQDVEGEPRVEVGWHVRRDRQRNGFATEAGAACIEHGFASLGLPEVISLIRPENRPSARVAEKLGMEVVGQTYRGQMGWLHNIYSMPAPQGQESGAAGGRTTLSP